MRSAPLSHSEIALLHSVFRSHPAVTEVRLFGSRAKGTHKNYSDIDLAIWGNVTPLQAQAIAAELDDLPLPYHYDVQVFDAVKSQELRAHIGRVGIALYPTPAAQLIPDEGAAATTEAIFQDLTEGRRSFWEVVLHTSPENLKEIIEKALLQTDGSYRKVADLLHLGKNEYRRFMDFLRRRNCLWISVPIGNREIQHVSQCTPSETASSNRRPIPNWNDSAQLRQPNPQLWLRSQAALRRISTSVKYL